jgi:transcriptional regulator with XRE-family HTH domain
MKNSKAIIGEAFASIPKENRVFARKLGQITARVEQLMAERGIKNQKELAKLLGKRESEISKWLNTSHNMTLKTLAKIEAALDADVIEVIGSRGFVPMTRSSIHLQVQRKQDFVELPSSDAFTKVKLERIRPEPQAA